MTDTELEAGYGRLANDPEWSGRPRHRHPANIARHDQLTATQRRVESFVAAFGSTRYLFWQTIAIVVWLSLNLGGWFVWHWDPYPFILLNLVFSTQAAYAAPLILLAQNRQTEHDRARAEHDYAVNEADAEVNRRALDRIDENTRITRRILDHLGITDH